MTRTLVAPSLLAADITNVGAEVRSIEQAGADWLHIDVMDGSFVPAITFGTQMVQAVSRLSKLHLDTHLMIREPERHVDAFAAAGTHRLTIHQEISPHLHRVLGDIRATGMKSGVALNPGTPVETIFDVLGTCDMVLIMTVNPGKGGQSFIESCISKIRKLRDYADSNGIKLDIEVDGGIVAATARRCVDAGANVLVSGTAIFGAKDRVQAIKDIRGS